jgi:hypothetical protein
MADERWHPPETIRDRLTAAAAFAVLFGVLALFVIGVLDGITTVVSWFR